MQDPKISVIIPIYNTEDYIEETLLSVINQTIFDEIEVIIVDDESTDNSKYIIEKYALDYSNIQVFHQKNEGQGISRNYGLSKSKGEYIHFLDSDDYLPPTAYETLYNMALKNESDIVIGNVLRFALYNVWEESLYKNAYNDFDEDIAIMSLNERPSILWDTLVTNKLFNREFLIRKNIRFPNKKISFQDIPFSLESYILADSISFSKEIFHYWRLRSNQSSVTQQDKSLKNIKDRLEILRIVQNLLEKYEVEEEIRNYEYSKWLNHDLKFFLKRFNYYPKEYHEELFEEVYGIVKIIPDALIDSLNSYKKVLFTMIRNKDYENFLLFAPLENELYKNPEIPSFLNDEYKSYFDFEKAMEEEELNIELLDFKNDNDNLYIDFDGYLNYLSPNDNYKIIAKLVDENDYENPLLVNHLENKQIAIPFYLLKDKKRAQIKVIYEFESFKKTAYLKNRHRKSIEREKFFIDLDLGKNSYLYLDIREKNIENYIDIIDISFNSKEFTIKAKSKKSIDKISMENIISFEKIAYPIYDLKYEENEDNNLKNEENGEYTFKFEIPYYDILKSAVKKWELNCDEYFNSIKLSETFEFFTETYKIKFVNTRNKILIENEIFNPIKMIYALNHENTDLKLNIKTLKGENSRLNKEIKKTNEKNEILNEENKKLIDKNKTLNKENKKLNKKIEEYKSRKVVKIVDSLKN